MSRRVTLLSAEPRHASLIAALEKIGAENPWSEEAIHRSLLLPTTRAWLALQREGPVGHLLGSAAAGIGEILTVVVHPKARRKGIGAALMGRCQEAWVEEGVIEGFLEVREDNAAARAMYGRLGWLEVGLRRSYYPDGEDARVLRWEASC